MNTYEKIIQLIKDNNLSYKEIRHDPVRTSEEAAQIRGDVSLSQGAKALITKCRDNINNKYFMMIVVPGDKRFNSKKVKALCSLKDITFAAEQEVIEITSGVVPGGVPPFGNLFNIKTIVEETLLNYEEIAFNAGDRSISIIMKSQDWRSLVNPVVLSIC
jgi:Ala-tRNA(Pro) deacylase